MFPLSLQVRFYIFHIHYIWIVVSSTEGNIKGILCRELSLRKKNQYKIMKQKIEAKTMRRNNPPVFHPLSLNVNVPAKWQDAKLRKKTTTQQKLKQETSLSFLYAVYFLQTFNWHQKCSLTFEKKKINRQNSFEPNTHYHHRSRWSGFLWARADNERQPGGQLTKKAI